MKKSTSTQPRTLAPLTNFTTQSETISALAQKHDLPTDLQLIAYATYNSTPLFIAITLPYSEEADDCVLLNLSDSLTRNEFLADCGDVKCEDCPIRRVCSEDYPFNKYIDRLLPDFRPLFPEYFV